jgi:hypothetical protein
VKGLSILVCCALQEDRKLGAAAAWENKTDSRIQENKLQQRFAALKAQADADLAARQDKLAQQLHAEEQALKQELISCQTTPAQRRAQMAARGHDLASRREAERQQLAAALLDQSFRDNCDPLRERNSRRLVYRTAQEREQQVCLALGVVERCISPYPSMQQVHCQCMKLVVHTVYEVGAVTPSLCVARQLAPYYLRTNIIKPVLLTVCCCLSGARETCHQHDAGGRAAHV